MRAIATKTIAIASAIGMGGFSSLLFAAAPAAADNPCGDGVLVKGNICEQTFTENGTFTATADMTQLQVLLVAGGGEGGYGGGGGGGQVEVVDFDGGTAPTLTISVGDEEDSSSVSDATDTATASGGGSSSDNTSGSVAVPGTSGASGNGNAGYPVGSTGGAGGGAGGAAKSRDTGGVGITAAKAPVVNPDGTSAAPTYKLFANDTACYGGGGAVGTGKADTTPGCDAGSVSKGGVIKDPIDGHGGGGASILVNPIQQYTTNEGASGVVVVRWNATPPVSLTFNDGSYGHTPATENLFSGDTPTKPTNPSVSGYTFKGWFKDAGFTTIASFAVPITASETFYAEFVKK